MGIFARLVVSIAGATACACTLLVPIDSDVSSSGSASSGSSSGGSSSSGSSSGGSSSSSGSSSSGGSSSGASGSSSGGDGGGCDAPETDLLAYYPLDETSGTVAHDCSGNHHDGNVATAPASGAWGAGKFGGGFLGDGSAGCINLGTTLALEGTSFTVALWAKVHTFTLPNADGRYLFGRTSQPNTAGWRVGTDANSTFGIKLNDSNGILFAQSVTGQPKDTWTHVAATFAPSSIVKLYVGGLPSLSRPLGTITVDGAASVRIACRGDGQSMLDGAVDEVRVYGRLFDDAAVAALAAKTP